MPKKCDGIRRELIRGRMAELGYNITTISAEIDVSRATMSAFLRGTAPSYAMMRKMQRALKLSATEASNIFFDRDLRNA